MTEQRDPSSATTFVRRPGLHAVETDGELVMMGHEQGEYYGLKDVAASLWEHLADPRTTDELCALVADEYSVTPQGCRADVVAFLDELAAKDLVERR